MKEFARSGGTGAVPPPLPPGVGRVERPAIRSGLEAVEAVDESAEQTEKWSAPPGSAAGELAEAGTEGDVVPPPPRLCVTVISRIPEMLAESMALAGDDEPPPPKR